MKPKNKRTINIRETSSYTNKSPSRGTMSRDILPHGSNMTADVPQYPPVDKPKKQNSNASRLWDGNEITTIFSSTQLQDHLSLPFKRQSTYVRPKPRRFARQEEGCQVCCTNRPPFLEGLKIPFIPCYDL
jgi:hypothetical protein